MCPLGRVELWSGGKTKSVPLRREGRGERKLLTSGRINPWEKAVVLSLPGDSDPKKRGTKREKDSRGRDTPLERCVDSGPFPELRTQTE